MYQLFCFRARPVIHLTKDFTVEPKIVDPNQCPVNTPWWDVFTKYLILNLAYSIVFENKLIIILCVCVFYSITATLCMSFTLSNGNKDFKKNISEQSRFTLIFFFFPMTNHVMCKLHKIKAAVYSYKLQMCRYWNADCRFLCCLMNCTCFCFVKRWSTQLRLTRREEEALVFVLRTIVMTLMLASWACHRPNPSVILWNCL